jgi:hypothetical protein
MVGTSVGTSSLKVSYPIAPQIPPTRPRKKNSLKTTGQQEEGKRKRGWVKKGRKEDVGGGGRLALYNETGGEFDAISYYPSCKCLNHAKHVRFLAS